MPDHAPSLQAPSFGLPDRLLAVEAAADALRRGLPAVIAADPPLALLAAETADETGLESFRRITLQAPVLLLAAHRAAAVGVEAPGPGTVALDAMGLALPELKALADPTLPQGMAQQPTVVAAPSGSDAALALAVLARLLPALLAAPAPGRVGVAIPDILQHAALSAAAVVRVSEAVVPLEDVADARLVAFRSPGTGAEHYAVLIGRPEDRAEPLVRVHSECFTGDLLGSLRCDCGAQLRGAIRRIAAEGSGAVLYLAQEGRGIGLPNKLRAYALQDRGLDTLDANLALGFAADERTFLTAAAMLRDLGLTRIRLLTNNPDKLASLAAHGITVAGRASLLFATNGVNDRYMKTKADRFNHLPS